MDMHSFLLYLLSSLLYNHKKIPTILVAGILLDCFCKVVYLQISI